MIIELRLLRGGDGGRWASFRTLITHRISSFFFLSLRCSIDAGWGELGIAAIMVRLHGPVMVLFFL